MAGQAKQQVQILVVQGAQMTPPQLQDTVPP